MTRLRSARTVLLGGAGAAALLVASVAAPGPEPPARPAALPPAPAPTGGAEAQSLSPQLAARCLEVARDVDPALADRLARLRQERSEQVFHRALRNARHLLGLARLKDEDPQLYDAKVKELRVDAQVNEVLTELAEARRAGSPAAADLERKLRGLVERQVGLSLVARGMYLQRLNDHVQALREKLTEDLNGFSEAVDRRYRRLLERVETE